MTREETVDQIRIIAKAMMVRCDEIAGHGAERKVCNMFLPHEARKRVDLILAFIAVLAQSPSMAPIADAQPMLVDLQRHLQLANAAVVNCLPLTCRNLIACISSGEQFFLNLLLRGDSTAIRLAKLAHPLSIPLRQLFLLCSQKLHEQLTVGC